MYFRIIIRTINGFNCFKRCCITALVKQRSYKVAFTIIRVYTVQLVYTLPKAPSSRIHASYRIVFHVSFYFTKHFRCLIPKVILLKFVEQQRFCESSSSTELEKISLGKPIYGRFICQGGQPITWSWLVS